MNHLATLLAIVTIAAVVFSIPRPGRVLTIYIISRPMIQPFIFLQQSIFSVPYSMIWACILPLLYGIYFVQGRWKLVCHKNTPLLIILVLSAFSIAVSVDTFTSVAGLAKIAAAVFAYGAAFNIVKGTDAAETIIKSIIYSSFVPLLFGFYQQITGDFSQIHTSVTGRVNSVFGVGNGYGIYLTITMCAVMMMLLKPGLTKNARFLYVGYLGAMAASQILALNRGTWIALSGAIVVALFPYWRKVKVRWFVIGAIVIAVAFSGVIIKRFTEATYRWDGTQADTLQNRIDHWNYRLPQLLNRPILGYGIGTTGDADGHKAPHNDYLRFALDIGVVGSLAYVYFLISLALFYLRRTRTRRGNELWRYNFPMAVLCVYFVVISGTQNIIDSFINFGFFLMLNGAIVKLNLLKPQAMEAKPVPRRRPLLSRA